jgi:hypothetical protein
MLLAYADAPGATATVRDDIRTKYDTSIMTGDDNLPAHTTSKDPYLAHMKDYVWGSNSTKANQGNMFWAMVTHGIDPTQDATMMSVAERYIHYLHGVNPLGLVYLTNMGSAGATHSVTSIFHYWYNETSACFAFSDGDHARASAGIPRWRPQPKLRTGQLLQEHLPRPLGYHQMQPGAGHAALGPAGHEILSGLQRQLAAG